MDRALDVSTWKTERLIERLEHLEEELMGELPPLMGDVVEELSRRYHKGTIIDLYEFREDMTDNYLSDVGETCVNAPTQSEMIRAYVSGMKDASTCTKLFIDTQMDS